MASGDKMERLRLFGDRMKAGEGKISKEAKKQFSDDLLASLALANPKLNKGSDITLALLLIESACALVTRAVYVNAERPEDGDIAMEYAMGLIHAQVDKSMVGSIISLVKKHLGLGQ